MRFRAPVPRAVLVLAATHFVADGYSNIYAPLLPLLIPKLGLSLAMAGMLTTVLQLGSSFSQLGFGHLADRWRPRVLLVAGPFVSVVVLSFVGVAPNPVALGAVLLVGGLGGAAFHPTAAAVVHHLGGRHSGLAMALHITGGSLGFSLAPLLFAPFAQRAGPEWIPVLAVPGVVVLALLLRNLPPTAAARSRQAGGLLALKPWAVPLGLLWSIVVLRTMVSLSFATFVPVMLVRRGVSVGAAGAAVSAYLFASAAGGLTGGPLADRFGHRRLIMLSMICAVPFLVAAPMLSGWAFVATLTAAGFCLQSTLPVNVTFAHLIAPINAGTVSSLMMGFAWGSGGLAVPAVGLLADRVGVEATLRVMAFAPLLAAALAWSLPRMHATRAVPAEMGTM